MTVKASELVGYSKRLLAPYQQSLSSDPNVDYSLLTKRLGRHSADEAEAVKQRTAALRNRDWEQSKPVGELFMQSMASLFGKLFALPKNLTMKNELNTKMCENYGHIITGQKWIKGRIYCRDCATEVTDAQALRKSSPR